MPTRESGQTHRTPEVRAPSARRDRQDHLLIFQTRKQRQEMMESGHSEHVRTKRDTKIGRQCKRRITVGKLKRETRNVRSCPLSLD